MPLKGVGGIAEQEAELPTRRDCMEYLIILVLTLVLIERILNNNKEVTAITVQMNAVTSNHFIGANRLPAAPFSLL